MSPNGLKKLLAGADPYSATRQKLRHWFHSRQAASLSLPAVIHALDILTRDLAPAETPRAMRTLIEALEEVYGAGEDEPVWLQELRERASG